MSMRREASALPTGGVKFSVEGNEVRVYCTADGLERLIKIAKGLLDRPQQGHVHLEDYSLLTADSMQAVVAVFDASDESPRTTPV